MLKTSLDGKIAEWETAERDVPEPGMSGSGAPKFMAFGINHALFNADGLKSNAGRYHDSSAAWMQRATAHSAANRMQWILLSLLSGTALSACGGGGGGGGGAPVVKKPDPKPDEENNPSTPVVKKPDPLPEELIKATPEPVKKETSEASAEGEDEGEAPLDQEPTGLVFVTPRGTAQETVDGTYTAAAGRKLSDINITDDGKGVNRVFLKGVESHRYFEVKKNPITGAWELWLQGNMSLPDPGAITAEIGINSDGFGNVAGVSARYTLTVENTPEAPTVARTTNQRGKIQETAPDETTSAATTGIRFATHDEDGDGISAFIIKRQNEAGEWVAETRFEVRGNELRVKAGQTFDFNHGDNDGGIIKLRVIAVDNSSEKLRSTPLEFEIRLSELPPSDPEDGGETPDIPETASSTSDWQYRIYENRPLDLPILKLPQRFIDSGFNLSSGYGDNGLFQLYGNKLMYVHKLGTGW